MSLFGVCLVLYFLKLSASNGLRQYYLLQKNVGSSGFLQSFNTRLMYRAPTTKEQNKEQRTEIQKKNHALRGNSLLMACQVLIN